METKNRRIEINVDDQVIVLHNVGRGGAYLRPRDLPTILLYPDLKHERWEIGILTVTSAGDGENSYIVEKLGEITCAGICDEYAGRARDGRLRTTERVVMENDPQYGVHPSCVVGWGHD